MLPSHSTKGQVVSWLQFCLESIRLISAIKVLFFLSTCKEINSYRIFGCKRLNLHTLLQRMNVNKTVLRRSTSTFLLQRRQQLI